MLKQKCLHRQAETTNNLLVLVSFSSDHISGYLWPASVCVSELAASLAWQLTSAVVLGMVWHEDSDTETDIFHDEETSAPVTESRSWNILSSFLLNEYLIFFFLSILLFPINKMNPRLCLWYVVKCYSPSWGHLPAFHCQRSTDSALIRPENINQKI